MGEGVAGSQPMSAHGAQINFEDLTPYLTFDFTVYVCAGYRMNLPEKHTSGKTRQYIVWWKKGCVKKFMYCRET
jgi:hypothetical protein